MNVKKRVSENERIQRTKNYYQYGNTSFLEAVKSIMSGFESGEIASDEAELAIRQISRIKLPY